MQHIKEPSIQTASFEVFSLLPRFYYVSQVIAVIHSLLALYGVFFRLNKSSTCLAWWLRKFSKKMWVKDALRWRDRLGREEERKRSKNASNEKGQTNTLQTILSNEWGTTNFFIPITSEWVVQSKGELTSLSAESFNRFIQKMSYKKSLQTSTLDPSLGRIFFESHNEFEKNLNLNYFSRIILIKKIRFE